MELDDYKTIIRQRPIIFKIKALPELERNTRGRTESLISIIKKNLKLEIIFASLFLFFDSYLIVFSKHHQRGFAFLLWVFCICFIYYLVKLLQYIQIQHVLIVPIKNLLERYVKIIHRFSRLYFQLSMVIIPLIFFLVFIAGYLDQDDQQSNFAVSYSSQRFWTYLLVSALWSLSMFFFTRWYLKKLYGNYLAKLKEQLKELQENV